MLICLNEVVVPWNLRNYLRLYWNQEFGEEVFSLSKKKAKRSSHWNTKLSFLGMGQRTTADLLLLIHYSTGIHQIKIFTWTEDAKVRGSITFHVQSFGLQNDSGCDGNGLSWTVLATIVKLSSIRKPLYCSLSLNKKPSTFLIMT